VGAAEQQCLSPEAASSFVGQFSECRFVPNPDLRSLASGGLGHIASSVLPSSLRLNLQTWLLQPGTRVSCTVVATEAGTAVPESVLRGLVITVTLAEAVLETEQEVTKSLLQLHFSVTSAGLHVVTARLASQHILGSPLLLPVLTDPARVLAQLGLQLVDHTRAAAKPAVLRQRSMFNVTAEPVKLLRQPRGPVADSVGFAIRKQEVVEAQQKRKELVTGSLGKKVLTGSQKKQDELVTGSIGKEGVVTGSIGKQGLVTGSIGKQGVVTGSIGKQGLVTGSIGKQGVVSKSRGKQNEISRSEGEQEELVTGSQGKRRTFVSRVGQVCLARWTDGVWYRARVEASDGRRCKVTFVDYGNSDTVAVTEMVACLDDIPESDLENVDTFVKGTLATTVKMENPEKSGRTARVGRTKREYKKTCRCNRKRIGREMCRQSWH
jgi:hypothetical protein